MNKNALVIVGILVLIICEYLVFQSTASKKKRKMVEMKKYLWNLYLPLIKQKKFFNDEENAYLFDCTLENKCPLRMSLKNFPTKEGKKVEGIILTMFDPNNGKILIEYLDTLENKHHPYPTLVNAHFLSELPTKEKIKIGKDFLKIFEHGIVELDKYTEN